MSGILLSHHLDHNAFFSPAVEFGVENPLPRPQVQPAFGDGRDDLVVHEEIFEVGVAVGLAGAVVAVDESEDAEYAALVEAAEVSAEMSGGGRRVVVVAEVPHEGAVAPLRDVASVHVDTQDGADPDDELAGFATQEIPHLLE